ncbi:MAG: hypothetical protein WA996_03345 [Candidatus Promineifilaceae bacterium]
MNRSDGHFLIFFVDGVGLGADDPEVNPFIEANLPNLTGLLGERWYLRPDCGGPGRITTDRVSLVPTDPNLKMPGRPQSATGQATILTGRNVPQIVGEHYGPKPNPAVAAVVKESNLFKDVIKAGGTAALITPYPQGYFDSIKSGKRLLSSVPLAAVSAGLDLMTAEDLRAGRAVSPGFTGQGWHDYLGYDDIPVHTLHEAGQEIAIVARDYSFSFFEHWPSDRSGHRGSIDQASQHLEIIDAALGGLFDTWNDENDLLLITSDHGNIEEKNHRQHSRNPVPTILLGPDHAKYAEEIQDLADIAGIVRSYLAIETH